MLFKSYLEGEIIGHSPIIPSDKDRNDAIKLSNLKISGDSCLNDREPESGSFMHNRRNSQPNALSDQNNIKSETKQVDSSSYHKRVKPVTKVELGMFIRCLIMLIYSQPGKTSSP